MIAAATQEMLDQMLADRRSGYDVEKRYRRKDGTVIWVRVSTARPADPESDLRGIPTIIEDITERKRAEDAMHEARDALLRVARLSTMGELSASIAHEINQPLGAIVANGQACLRFLPSRHRTSRKPERPSRKSSATAGAPAKCSSVSADWQRTSRRNEDRSTSTMQSAKSWRSPDKRSRETGFGRRPNSIPTSARSGRPDSDAAGGAEPGDECHRGDA